MSNISAIFLLGFYSVMVKKKFRNGRLKNEHQCT